MTKLKAELRMELNFSNLTAVNTNAPIGYMPDQQCALWSIEQHITAYHNVETQAVLFVAGALVFIIAYEFCQEHQRFKKYGTQMLYFAKICMYIFFFMYLMVFKFNLIHYMQMV